MRGSNVLVLPLIFTLGLAGLGIVPSVRENSTVFWTVLGVSGALAAWNILLAFTVAKGRRELAVEMAPRKQHYVQALAQGSVFLYWGWYWPQVYSMVPLLIAQLVFAYAFDMMLAWSRRDTYRFGFSPFPVVFSINLFLWFRQDWFYLQFLVVALGLAAKEFICWTKDGRRTHIFNPSSFPLAVFSIILLATGATDLTWGREIASTQFYPPHMYLFLFLIGLPGQYFFGVTLMTMSAVISTYLFGLAYFATTGVYFFYDSYIPIAVFLGMHLLFTDPSTSPRTELGRVIFGAVYGLSTVALYQLLGSMGMPTFYDKLLQVPFLNLSIKGIDRMVQSRFFRLLEPTQLARTLAPRQRHVAFMSLWAIMFVAMTAAGGVGDSHPGQWLPFWQQACTDGRLYACPYAADLQSNFCERGSGWACNEAGLLHIELWQSGEDLRRSDVTGAARSFKQGCELGSDLACRNLDIMKTGIGEFAKDSPELSDYPIILRGSKGEIWERDPASLYTLACHQGWQDACRHTADLRR